MEKRAGDGGCVSVPAGSPIPGPAQGSPTTQRPPLNHLPQPIHLPISLHPSPSYNAGFRRRPGEFSPAVPLMDEFAAER